MIIQLQYKCPYLIIILNDISFKWDTCEKLTFSHENFNYSVSLYLELPKSSESTAKMVDLNRHSVERSLSNHYSTTTLQLEGCDPQWRLFLFEVVSQEYCTTSYLFLSVFTIKNVTWKLTSTNLTLFSNQTRKDKLIQNTSHIRGRLIHNKYSIRL